MNEEQERLRRARANFYATVPQPHGNGEQPTDFLKPSERLADGRINPAWAAAQGGTVSADGQSLVQTEGAHANPPSLPPTVEEIRSAVSEIETRLTKGILFQSENDAAVLAMWVLHTYFIPQAAEKRGGARTTPYIWVHSSEIDSGKSTLILMLEQMVRNPEKSDNTTASVMYRLLDSGTYPTLLLDEIDGVFGGKGNPEKANDILTIANSGYKVGGSATRTERVRGGEFEVKKWRTFGAKALAGLKTLPPSLTSRVIEVELKRAMAAEGDYDVDLDELEDAMPPVRDVLYRFAETTVLPMREAVPVDGLRNRQRELWRPLLLVAEALGDGWPERMRAAAAVGKKPQIEKEYKLLLLEHMKWFVFGTGGKFDPKTALSAMSTETILHRLYDLPESPWNDPYHKGKALTDRQLSTLLGEYGWRPTRVRIGEDRAQVRGYKLEGGLDAIRRYVGEFEDDGEE